MRLKRVKLFGFKTFADRTEFELEGGIVSVVGPNGCGKSNLVDAILWGLGEGNARHLRAGTNQDVIFSGSEKRKAVGYAEVSLCFDNEDGTLPIDSSEVWITRRVTRNGDSSYQINRQSCRLKDVLELLADSGLGRAGYAIVGQKEIDSALSASAEDRRAWIDEAAGVQRYRARKVESLRRLSSAKDHLARVEDIVIELDAQREPLAEEADSAKRYRVLTNSLREVEIGLLIRDLVASIENLESLEERIDSSRKILESQQKHAEMLEHQFKDNSQRMVLLDVTLEGIRTTHQDARLALERAESQRQLLEAKTVSLNTHQQSLFADGEQIEARVAEAEADLILADQELKNAIVERDSVELAAGGQGAETKQISQALRTAEAELQDARNQRALRMKWEAESEANQNRIRHAKREIDGANQSIPVIKQALEKSLVHVGAQQAELKRIEAEIATIQLECDAIRVAEEQDATALRSSLAERATLEGKRRGIESTLDAFEGVAQGAKSVMEANQQKLLEGHYEIVADSIEVDKEVAVAIETALGASANDLIVETEQDAKRAIQWLKENRAGRATFQPISLMKPADISHELRRTMSERGIVGRASELTKCRQNIRPVIESLLGRILIVETLDDALRIVGFKGWSRLVTLEGEVVHNSGAVTGGRSNRQTYGVVQRKADLAEVEKKLCALNTLVSGAESRTDRRSSDLALLQAQLVELQSQFKLARDPLEEADQFARAMESELRDAERHVTKVRQEVEALEHNAAHVVAPIDTAPFETTRDELFRSLASKSADAEQASVRLRAAQERVATAKSRLGASQKRFESTQDAMNNRGKRLANLGPEREAVAEQLIATQASLGALEQNSHQSMLRLTEVSRERTQALDDSVRLADEVKSARDNLTSLADTNHQTEILRARGETKRATYAERLMDAYGLSEQDAVAQNGMHEIPADAPSVVAQLRREIKAMGIVNIGAIEAFERLSERLSELTSQRDDINSGIEQVMQSIRELDKLTRDRFLNTFNSVSEQFSIMFDRLFGGGQAKMALNDETNILESGVDIIVQLPGKKQQPLPLLSGGERSLCASAFLFALLRVKPAPLVVLDEVDAPLDGRNVERFTQLLLEFSEMIQFIVVTHNPTTIAASPSWFGVSMQEPGVSMLLPTKVPATASSDGPHLV